MAFPPKKPAIPMSTPPSNKRPVGAKSPAQQAAMFGGKPVGGAATPQGFKRGGAVKRGATDPKYARGGAVKKSKGKH